MAKFQVDSTEVATAAATARNCADQLRDSASSMLAQLHSLENSWSGSAQSAFSNCATRWQTTQNQIEEDLKDIGTALDNASSAYADAESKASTLFSK